MEINIAWQNLEQAIAEVDQGVGATPHQAETLAAAIYLLMEYPPHDILAQAQASDLPTRATVSWIIFEAGRISQIDPAQVEALRAAWQETCSHLGEIIPPHPAMCGS